MITIKQNMTGYHVGVNPLSDTLQRINQGLRIIITREGMFAFMAVVRRSTYAAAPFATFRGPSGYRGRITSTRGGGAKAKFASAGFGNIIEAGARKRHLAALQPGQTSRGQITPGMLAWIEKNAPSLAAELREDGAESVWVRPMDPRPWVLPTYHSVQSQAMEAFAAEVARQIEILGAQP
jgi:hypothetical protein